MAWNTPSFWYAGFQSYVSAKRKAKTAPTEILTEVQSLDKRVREEYGAKSPEYQKWHALVLKEIKPETAAMRGIVEQLNASLAGYKTQIKDISSLLEDFDEADSETKADRVSKAVRRAHKPAARESGRKAGFYEVIRLTREAAFERLGWKYSAGLAYKIFSDRAVPASRVEKLQGLVIYSQALPRLAKKTGLSTGTLGSFSWRQENLDKKYLINIGSSKIAKIMAYEAKKEKELVKFLKNR